MKYIFEQEDSTIAVMAINETFLSFMTPVAAGKFFIPAGKKFKIIENENDLPDEEFWPAWRVDFTEYDGIGEKV